MTLRAIYDVAAPAKLNLFLHVVGRRGDGYHLLESLFVLIDWCDTLHFELRQDGMLKRHDLGTALPPDDLCLRAARALQAASGTPLGADILIDKQVPWGAGLGGGSSDAASTLLALNRLWGLRWSRSRLLALGLTLGADVPFFLGGRNAFVEGIGERLTPVAVAQQWLAVLKPAANIETRAIFASPLLARSQARHWHADILESLSRNGGTAPIVQDATASASRVCASRTCASSICASGVSASEISASEISATGMSQPGFGRNDLQPAAQAQCPEVAQAAAVLQAAFGNSRMTGSGSAVFSRAGTAEQADSPMPLEIPAGWVGRMSRSLVAHPLDGWAED